MSDTWSKAVREALHTKRHPIKGAVRIPAVWERDSRGRFVRLVRKAHVRYIRDRTRKVSGLEQMAENITMHNVLLKRFKHLY